MSYVDHILTVSLMGKYSEIQKKSDKHVFLRLRDLNDEIGRNA